MIAQSIGVSSSPTDRHCSILQAVEAELADSLALSDS